MPDTHPQGHYENMILSLSQKKHLSVNFALFIFIALSAGFFGNFAVAQDIPPPPESPSQKIDIPPPPDTGPPSDLPPPSAQTSPSASPGETPPAPLEDGALPDIEAKTYTLKTLKMSTSKKVYLLEVTSVPSASAAPSGPDVAGANIAGIDAQTPPTGKILLLRLDGQNIMAMRVLRSLAGTKQLFAKRIKAYDGNSQLELSKEYTAIEKISDIVPPPPTEQDKADISEVMPAPLPFDPELDAGSSPDPGAAPPEPSGTEEKSDEPPLGAAVEEHNTPFEKYDNWVSLGLAALRSNPSYYFYGTKIGYSRDLADRIFTFEDNRIDTFSIDLAFAYYQIVGFGVNATYSGGSYTMMPLMASLRYTYYYHENFGIFGYIGGNYGLVLSSTNPDSAELTNLQTVNPAIGVGFIVRVGPQWYTRLDAGYDMIGLSLMLRF